MYVYFDRNGTLKELINNRPERQGSQNWNNIYVYWEGEAIEQPQNAWVRYTRADGTLLKTEQQKDAICVPSQSLLTPNTECIIPFDENQDLKFFKYNTQYKFYKFTIPSDVLELGGNVVVRIRYVDTNASVISNSNTIESMGLFTFDIEDNKEYVAPEVVMSVAQYNQLISLLSKQAHIYFVSSVQSVDEYEDGAILLNTTDGKFYKVSGTPKTATFWDVFDYLSKTNGGVVNNQVKINNDVADPLVLNDLAGIDTDVENNKVIVKFTTPNQYGTGAIKIDGKELALSENVPSISFVDSSSDPQTKKYIKVNNVDYKLGGQWGEISGTIANQTDLQIALNGKENADATILKQADVKDNLNSTDTNKPLSANMGKSLQDQINNLKSLGRFLSILNANTGKVASQPSGSVGTTYTYKVGDFYRVSVDGYWNPKTTTTFTIDNNDGHSNFEQTTTKLKAGDVIYVSNVSSSGTTWVIEEGTTEVPVLDVQTSEDGTTYTSVVNNKIAQIDLSSYLKKSGGTLSGSLQMNGNPINFGSLQQYFTFMALNNKLNIYSTPIAEYTINYVDENYQETTLFKINNNVCQYKGEDLTSVEIIDWE